ncbi:MAG: hypothetical protein K9N21_08660 [Deltaproteobacteria bacterium]|nr:hypothetical protein [Deltaproteobacteria bacterium]
MLDLKDVYSPKTRIKRLPLSEYTKLIIMSDMHRGDGTGSDDFAHNSLVYKCALDYYLRCQMSDVRGQREKTEVRGLMSE